MPFATTVGKSTPPHPRSQASECGQLVKRAQLGPQGVSEAKVGKAAALFLADYDKRAAAAAHAERAAAE